MSRYQKGKTNLDFLKQETVSGSGISWAIRKSAPSSRQITTSAPHHSDLLQAGCPSCHTTNSVKALKAPIHACTMCDMQQMLLAAVNSLHPLPRTGIRDDCEWILYFPVPSHSYAFPSMFIPQSFPYSSWNLTSIPTGFPSPMSPLLPTFTVNPLSPSPFPILH